jgi:electron-transferring-flavoprotein dehydrogenase
MPPLMNNHGNYIVSLGDVCRWLAARPRRSASRSIRASPPSSPLRRRPAPSPASPPATWASARRHAEAGFQRGMALRAKYTLIAEGARGSLAKQLIAPLRPRRGTRAAEIRHRLKELWQVEPAKHRPGLVQHTFGWPLDNRTGGGSFLYHLDENLVSVGFVVHLNYKNPHLSPFEEFQRFKTHPAIRDTSRAASASPTAPAPSPRAAGSRCRSSSSRAAR